MLRQAWFTGRQYTVQAQACCLQLSKTIEVIFDCIPQRQSSNRAGAVAGKSDDDASHAEAGWL